MKKKICDFVFNNRKNFVLIMYLYAFLCAFFPYSKIANLFSNSLAVTNISFILSRIILSVFPFLIYIFCTKDLMQNTTVCKKYYIIPLFIVCLNNFPFISIFIDKLSVSTSFSLWIDHVFKCLSISFLEELVFRCVIFTLVYDLFSKNKLFLSILVSSIMFGCLHVVNLFTGENLFYVALQIGYSFLTGVLFSLSYFISKKMIVPIILHFTFNFGGLLQENGLVFGQIWCVYQVVETVIISVLVGVFTLYLILKYNRENNYESSSSKG